MFRFTMINHFCNDMPTLMDTTRPSDRIRQDVARSPGGDSRMFLNNCVGCHSGMDPMVQAFAYYNFNGTLGAVTNTGTMVYTPGQVQPKYFINATNFPFGFVTPDDSWENRWRTGPKRVLGWSPALPGSGNGAKSLGQELESSTTFAQLPGDEGVPGSVLPRAGKRADLATVGHDHLQFYCRRLQPEEGVPADRRRLPGVLKGARHEQGAPHELAAFVTRVTAHSSVWPRCSRSPPAAGGAPTHGRTSGHGAGECGAELHRAGAG